MSGDAAEPFLVANGHASQTIDELPHPPPIYNYNDWHGFLRQAMRYHDQLHPDQTRVIDRINTLRQYMAEPVISHLGSFMKPHPRYRTTQGWDLWVRSVSAMLSERDVSLRSITTANDWVARYKQGKCSEVQLWQELDSLAVYDDITSEEQRSLFWNALSWNSQARLEAQCPFFDPNNDVWSEQKPGVLKEAEQRLAQFMELAQLDNQVVAFKPFLIAACTFLALAFLTFCFSFLSPHRFDSKSFWSALPIISGIFVCLALTVTLLLFAIRRQRRNARNKLAESILAG